MSKKRTKISDQSGMSQQWHQQGFLKGKYLWGENSPRWIPYPELVRVQEWGKKGKIPLESLRLCRSDGEGAGKKERNSRVYSSFSWEKSNETHSLPGKGYKEGGGKTRL